MSFFILLFIGWFVPVFIKRQNIMKKETKEEVQIYTAVGMLMSGVGLSVAGFVVEPTGQIHESVLWFFAQCLMYAGGILGIGVYVTTKFNHLVDKLKDKEENKNG